MTKTKCEALSLQRPSVTYVHVPWRPSTNFVWTIMSMIKKIILSRDVGVIAHTFFRIAKFQFFCTEKTLKSHLTPHHDHEFCILYLVIQGWLKYSDGSSMVIFSLDHVGVFPQFCKHHLISHLSYNISNKKIHHIKGSQVSRECSIVLFFKTVYFVTWWVSRSPIEMSGNS